MFEHDPGTELVGTAVVTKDVVQIRCGKTQVNTFVRCSSGRPGLSSVSDVQPRSSISAGATDLDQTGTSAASKGQRDDVQEEIGHDSWLHAPNIEVIVVDSTSRFSFLQRAESLVSRLEMYGRQPQVALAAIHPINSFTN